MKMSSSHKSLIIIMIVYSLEPDFVENLLLNKLLEKALLVLFIKHRIKKLKKKLLLKWNQINALRKKESWIRRF